MTESTYCSTHAFAPRDQVTVFRLELPRRPFIEGRATIVAPIEGMDDLYRLRFDGEQVVRRRLVYPGLWQTDLQGQLRRMLAGWQLTLMPELLADFIPDRS